MTQHVNSYYAAGCPKRSLYHDDIPSAGVDVVVLGAGFAGLTTALELARSGKSVAICEAERVGWGASGRNGGFVLDGYPESTSVLERKLGRAQATDLHRLSLEGVDYVRRTIHSSDRQDIIKGQGSLELVRHPVEYARAVDEIGPYEASTRVVPKSDLGKYVCSNRYHLGFLDEQSFHINPLAYAELLLKLLREAGGLVQENTPVVEVKKDPTGLIVETRSATIRAGHVVFCGSAYMSGINGSVSRAVLPVATYMVATEPLGDKADAILPFRGCLSDTRRAGDYFRLVDDGRLLWGGRMTTEKSEPTALAEMLRADILDVFPQLGRFRIEHAWSGLMGYCTHKMPLIASLGDGLWVNTGFGGHGVATTATGGILIAEAIARDSDRYKAFEPFKARWAGGQFGRLATQAIYWKRQMQDAWDERGNR